MTPFNDIIIWKSHQTIEIDKESPQKESVQQYHEGVGWPEFLPNAATADEDKSPESKCTQKSIVNLNVEEVEQLVQEKEEIRSFHDNVSTSSKDKSPAIISIKSNSKSI